MLTSEAPKPLTVPPKELLSPPGGFNPTLLMFLAAVGIVVLSVLGYWVWQWQQWICLAYCRYDNS